MIIETFKEKNPIYVPGVLCTNRGPFTWGKDAAEAVHNAVVLEEVAKMAYRTEHFGNQRPPSTHNICRTSTFSENMEKMHIMGKGYK